MEALTFEQAVEPLSQQNNGDQSDCQNSQRGNGVASFSNSGAIQTAQILTPSFRVCIL